ncbi:hypothetical protein TSOC_013648, partial [Tetrabaena socialis]
CFPPTHGHGELSLLAYEVREVRARLTRHRGAETALPHSVPLAPAAWPDGLGAGSKLASSVAGGDPTGVRPVVPMGVPPSAAAVGAVAAARAEAGAAAAGAAAAGLRWRQDPGRANKHRGQAALEGKRRQQAVEPHQAVERQPEEPPGPRPQGVPRPPSQPQTPTAHQAAWLRLWSAPAGNRAKVLGWRLAHACLPCGLYVTKARQRFDGHLCCEEECREHSVGRRPRASLSHLFCECPLYTAAPLLLGDQPSAWPGYPSSPGRQQLWTVLRLCFLHAVWCVHMDRDHTAHHAHAVVAHTVAALRHLMWAQFRMTALSDTLLEPLPTRLLSAQLKADRLADFSAVWAWRRVLCEVELPPAGAAEGPRLRVFLSLAAPVPAPAAPAPAGPLGGQQGPQLGHPGLL